MIGGVILILLGIAGCVMHVRGASIETGQWIGSSLEMEFIGGTLLALLCLPIGLVMVSGGF